MASLATGEMLNEKGRCNCIPEGLDTKAEMTGVGSAASERPLVGLVPNVRVVEKPRPQQTGVSSLFSSKHHYHGKPSGCTSLRILSTSEVLYSPNVAHDEFSQVVVPAKVDLPKVLEGPVDNPAASDNKQHRVENPLARLDSLCGVWFRPSLCPP